MNSPETRALERIAEQEAFARRLLEIGRWKAALEQGCRSATPERRAERLVQKEARCRKKAERRRGRR